MLSGIRMGTSILLAGRDQSLQKDSVVEAFIGKPTVPRGRACRRPDIVCVWKPPKGTCCQLASENGLRSEVGVGIEYSDAESDTIEPLRSSMPLYGEGGVRNPVYGLKPGDICGVSLDTPRQ